MNRAVEIQRTIDVRRILHVQPERGARLLCLRRELEELALGLDHGFAFVSSSVEITALSGKPPPMPLPTVMMSGATSS